jgi:hypothetical protein
MSSDPQKLKIKLMFDGLNKGRVTGALPPIGSLSIDLNSLLKKDKQEEKEYSVAVEPAVISHFATASVEMWQRAIHSFLISSSLTKSSPIWSSVAGYYSSHYSVRAFAHLLGYFQLFTNKRIVELDLSSAKYYCQIKQKGGNDREHKFYWKVVKQHPLFSADPFFTNNEEMQPNSSNDKSDISHRSKANYLDHVNHFPNFAVLNEEYLKQRIKVISSIKLSDAPIPKVNSYPDLDSVQLMAYHRMVKYSNLVDGILGGKNRYWNINRRPTWCTSMLDFQIVAPEYTSIYSDRL